MLFHAPSRVMAMSNIVGSAVSRIKKPAKTSEGKFELTNATFRGIRPNCAVIKDNVIGVVYSGAAPA